MAAHFGPYYALRNMIGISPVGQWELALADVQTGGDTIGQQFNNGMIEDIILLITYTADRPEWPS